MRVLIAEDDPISRRVLEVTLSNWGYGVVVAQDGAEALRLLRAPNCPRVAILDWMMPGLDGIEVCRQLRSKRIDRYVYVILLTARNEKKDIVRGIEAGADDYITKPFESIELKARLLAGSRIIELEEQLSEAQEQLRHQVMHDSLTGLWNRSAILERLETELGRSRRDGTPVSIILADIDRFKGVNDTYGHQIGDAVIRQVALRMSAALRVYDCVGRYGGEEFLIVLPSCDVATARMLAERLWESVRQDAEYPVTCSFGVSTSDATSLDSHRLIGAADTALYSAKAQGRDRIVITGNPESQKSATAS
jgi:diguanylate cyclase (GGDEF)-like protein